MSLEAKSFQLALNYATWSYNGYNGCTDCRVLAVYTGYTVCHVLRPQNKMSSPREVLWTYARGVHPFELEREEILISEEFRKRQETVKWRGFDTFRVGKKKWKMRNVPRPPHRRFQIPAPFGGFLSFPKYLRTPSLISFWATDRTFYSAVVIYRAHCMHTGYKRRSMPGTTGITGITTDGRPSVTGIPGISLHGVLHATIMLLELLQLRYIMRNSTPLAM